MHLPQDPVPQLSPSRIVVPERLLEKIRDGERSHIMFVCIGNYSRSPALEMLARQEIKAEKDIRGVQVTSRGMKELECTGRKLHRYLREALIEQGIDPMMLASFRSRLATATEIAESDLIISASSGMAGLIQTQWGEKLPIIDLPMVVNGSQGELFDPSRVVMDALARPSETQLNDLAELHTGEMIGELRRIIITHLIPALKPNK